MEFNFEVIGIMLALFVLADVITFIILYLALNSRGRKAPLGVVTDSLKMYWLINLKRNKRFFQFEKLENKSLWYTDWDRGVGYGYNDPPFRIGDEIHVKAPKGKVHILVVYRLTQPIPDTPEFFMFRTFYIGTKNARQRKQFKEYSEPKSFQCYDGQGD